MMIYVDSEHKCHPTNPSGAYRGVESDFFEGKCATFIEGYCYDDSNGYAQIYPGRPYKELAAAQLQYEADRAKLAEAYQEGVNSV